MGSPAGQWAAANADKIVTVAGAATTTVIVAASGLGKELLKYASEHPGKSAAQQDLDDLRMLRNNKSQQSNSQQGQQSQEGQSTNYQPNPKHDGPRGDDKRGVSPQPKAGGSLFDSATEVKPGQRVAVDHSSGKFVVYRTDPNGQTHGYETTWKGLRNDQRAALQQAGLVTKHGRIK